MGGPRGGSTWLLLECADPVILKTARGLRQVPRLQAAANSAAWGPAKTKGLAKAMDSLTCRVGVIAGAEPAQSPLFLQKPLSTTRSWGRGEGRGSSWLSSGGPSPGEKTGWGLMDRKVGKGIKFEMRIKSICNLYVYIRKTVTRFFYLFKFAFCIKKFC